MSTFDETLDSLRNILEKCDFVLWGDLEEIEFDKRLTYNKSILVLHKSIHNMETLKLNYNVDYFDNKIIELQRLAREMEMEILSADDVSDVMDITVRGFSRDTFLSDLDELLKKYPSERSDRNQIMEDGISAMRIVRRKLYSIPYSSIKKLSEEDQILYARNLSDLSLDILGWEENKLKIVNDSLAQQDFKSKSIKMKDDEEKIKNTIGKIRLVADALKPINTLLKLLKVIA